ncbi:uncharacterized protein LOC129573434 [Sitodiplosis mosellana]|uniref:uncharacterized protein LOC129573434 n=1 Tax=Sitodiplosis mosellana TaxID=263140 RepID=UPI0024440209|nr:uncharacterized protein LOC129573434 [Sitodiplosis mosellana]XP_055309900.1 uncharacterized protein LOC129573434 [Sitodiplosis mosellana]
MASVYKYMSLLRRPKKIIKLPPSIYSLTPPCLNEIFDYLSLKELHSFGVTCKKFQKIAGEYFQRTYRSTELRCAFDGIYACSDVSCNGQVSGFNQYIEHVSIHGNRIADEELDIFNYMKLNCNESLRKLQLLDVAITKRMVKMLRKNLKKIEVLEIDSCTMNGKLHRDLLRFCPNLKRLIVRRFGGNIKWLKKVYPKLEHLEIYQIGFKVDQLKKFFDRNKTIRSFSVDANCLWQNEDSILNANVKLDDLIVDIYGWEFRIDSIIRLLNRLYEQNFYKHLHLYAPYTDQPTTEQIAALQGLYKLYLTNYIAYAIFLPHLNDLRELSLRSCPEFFETEILAAKFVSLQCVFFEQANLSDILPFVHRLVNLEKINVDHFKNEDKSNLIVDLQTMNDEREKLFGAHKVTIFVEENVYLYTKWAMKSTNLTFVELKRSESYEWSHHFEYSHRSC